MRHRHDIQTSRGYVLITSLIFLLVLTLVAITATKNTTLELRMSRNFTDRMQTFEISETARLMVNELIDAHAFNRGWPVSQGGEVPDSVFGYTVPEGLDLDPDADGLEDLYLSNATGETLLDVTTLETDMRYERDVDFPDTSVAPDAELEADIVVFRLGATTTPGSGTAMISGYEGTGKGAAGGGGALFFHLRSLAQGATGATSVTGADFRHVIRN
ncbi:MAG TPA: PilX N-terminal domain-containing pilus assembly protein [Gammaproteobacteria bacterium]|nr:PilX N-terminal domain-containing pilus assembly protein [Gammaproteobacteria bacterium]